MKNVNQLSSFTSNIFAKASAFIDNYRLVFLLIGIGLLIILPYLPFTTFLVIRIGVLVMIYSTLGVALNFLTGYTGLVSIGHVAYFGFGAYASALMVTELNLNFFVALPIVILTTAIVGFLTSLPAIRLDGAYLTMATLGFGELFRLLVINMKGITGGVMGIKDIPNVSAFGLTFRLDNFLNYYLILAIMIVASLVCHLIIKSKTGRAFRSIKEDPLAAKLMGIRVTYYKGLAFVISAAITGAVGAYYAHFMRYIDPNTFILDISILILSIVILGGLGNQAGMYVGAFALIVLPQISRWLMEYRFVLYGLILILFMEFRPEGLLGGPPKGKYRLPKGVDE